MVAIANQFQPKLDPRYIASIEERVFIEGPQRRVPDLWIQKVREAAGMTAVAETEADTAVIVEVENLEIHETRVEILDAYNEFKLVALIEVVSPTNKAAGPGRVSYKAKQEETLARDCHLVEIDLLSHGRHVVCIPEWRVKPFKPFDSLCCVSRWPCGIVIELYPRKLRQRLPRLRSHSRTMIRISPRPPGRIRAGLRRGRYWRRIRYDQKCKPRLSSVDQTWADERIEGFARRGRNFFRGDPRTRMPARGSHAAEAIAARSIEPASQYRQRVSTAHVIVTARRITGKEFAPDRESD